MDLSVDEQCWVVGTFYKKMDLKPSILKEISATVCTATLVLNRQVRCEPDFSSAHPASPGPSAPQG